MSELSVAPEQLAGAHSARSLSMFLNSISVMLGKVATMGLGFLFWLIAARQFDQEQVGLAAGAVSAMMLCTQIALVGLGASVITLFSKYSDEPARLLNTALTLVVGTGLLVGSAFLLFSRSVFEQLDVVSAIPAYTVLFLIMSVLGTLGIVLDQASIGLRRGDYMMVRGVAFGAITLVLVAGLGLLTNADSSLAIFSPWVAAGAVTCLLGVLQLRRALPGYGYRPRVERAVARDFFRVGPPNYGLTLAERTPGLILPIVVTELLSPAKNATWYAAWMMAWVVYIIPISVGLALFAEGARSPEKLRAAIRQAIRSAFTIGVVAGTALAVVAPFALSLLGSEYAEGGVGPLRILVFGVIPMTMIQAYFATCRARCKLGEAVVTGWLNGIVSVAVAALVGVEYGLDGMALAWVATQVVTAIWAVWRLRVISRQFSRRPEQEWWTPVPAASGVTGGGPAATLD